MDYEITNRPAFTQLELTLESNEEIRAEAGSLVSHSKNVEVTAGMDDELVESLSDSMFDERRPFSTTFSANRPGTVTLAPPFPGDIFHYELRDESLYTPSSSFLAVEPGVGLDAELSGGRAFVESEGDFLLELSGSGLSFLSSYGAISVVSLNSDERYVVDTGHVVAFEQTVGFSVSRLSGVRSPAESGDGLICEFEGPGTIWMQSRSPAAFLTWLVPNLPDERQ
ncbi:TIGR00266 family protein [Haladaptatus caseinilyticus]|uniref:TIGR00266 family protein n=1 Tax=Haladaptatus caseinilyticus TaxID=2993314 RepID=UPI00224B90CF|nr:TIGR00266 family protein [Haladaptatus caseinilyticus]